MLQKVPSRKEKGLLPLAQLLLLFVLVLVRVAVVAGAACAFAKAAQEQQLLEFDEDQDEKKNLNENEERDNNWIVELHRNLFNTQDHSNGRATGIRGSSTSNQEQQQQHREAQGGYGYGGGGGSSKYMKVIHELFDNVDKIERVVSPYKENQEVIGVKTVTTSTDPDVAANIQLHVSQMADLLLSSDDGGRRIRQWDPLFVEIFDNADDYTMTYANYEDGDKIGVEVTESGTTPCAIALVQAHAQTVSAFVTNGHDEAMNEHAVPDSCD